MHVHIILLLWSGPPLSQDLQSSRAITRENHTQELGSQWDSYETKKEGCHKTIQTFTFSSSIVQYSHHPSLAKREKVWTQNLGISEIDMEQKRRLPQNKTNIHLLLFNSPVQPPSKLGKRERAWTRKLGSQRDSYGTKEKVATKQNQYSSSLIQQSSTATIQAWQKRESSNSETYESVR